MGGRKILERRRRRLEQGERREAAERTWRLMLRFLSAHLQVLLAATLISLTGRFSKSAPCLQVFVGLLSGGLALLGAMICFLTSGVALKDGPFCMFDVSSSNQTQAWKFSYPFKDLHNRNYLYDHSLWTSVCLEPSKAVVWHVAFFSVLLCISLLQLLLVAIHLVNSILSLFCSFCEKR
ncbi:transmembrane 4 L6 family member 19 isoform X2 [Rattus norvegicus]|uniref:transmembrane 4 L6 family member 19 isoform X2 n=1 Tax=Rattus norvegicus TaxID=10116 RepID=UPI002FD7D646